MPDFGALISILEEAKFLLSQPDNDFTYSYWEDSVEALAEVEKVQLQLRNRVVSSNAEILFLPAGPIQEVSLSSGWGQEFLYLADHFDRAMQDVPSECACFASPSAQLDFITDLGMDEIYGEVSVYRCSICGQRWLRYYWVNEAFTGSGRWYLGAVSFVQFKWLTAIDAKETLEALPWYFFGGSYFDGKTGKSSGKIAL